VALWYERVLGWRELCNFVPNQMANLKCHFRLDICLPSTPFSTTCYSTVWANTFLQGIVVPFGCCVHVFVFMPPGCKSDIGPLATVARNHKLSHFCPPQVLPSCHTSTLLQTTRIAHPSLADTTGMRRLDSHQLMTCATPHCLASSTLAQDCVLPDLDLCVRSFISFS
jgi:hypothetical protein